MINIPSLTQPIFDFPSLLLSLLYHIVNMHCHVDQRIVGIKITEIVTETERETVTETESEDRKKKNASEGRMKNGGGEGNVRTEKTPTKRERTKGRRTRSAFGRKERMKTPETPQLMLIPKSNQRTTKRKTVPKGTV